MKTQADQILEMIRQAGVLRSCDLAEAKIPRVYLSRLVKRGLIVSPSRGLYVLAGAEQSQHQSIAMVGRRVPHGVICLLSALALHNLTTQNPFEVWVAVANSDRRPTINYPPLRVVRFSKVAMTNGVEMRTIDGVPVRVTNPARTVTDCFKYRNKIGLDVAMEALRDCWSKRLATMDDLFRASQVCRVSRVIRPYLESLT